jgi:carbamoyltransferase
VSFVQEERFIRIKHTPEFPINSIKYCLEETVLSLNELDSVVFYDKPIFKFERLLSIFFSVAPKGLFSFLKLISVWIKEKHFLRKLIFDNLKKIK